MLSLVYPDLS
uniref:Uncharacterized protein n=1 Tax=Arundo donax TaxID=35708 RepID=A0A0A9F1H2_ARUDO